MPIEVELPDGSIAEFPDGTPNAVMENALRQHTAAPQSAPKPPDDSGFIHQQGLGLRSVVGGLTDLGGIVTNPLMYGLSKVTGQPYESFSDAGGRVLDEMGVPRPQTAEGRVYSDVGRALTGAGATMGAGSIPAASRYVAPATQKLGAFLTAQPGLQAVSTATGAGAAGITRERGGSPVMQTAAGLAGGFFPGAARYSMAAGTRGATRGGESGRQQMEQGIQDFRMLGVEPSVGQATGNRRTQGLESLLAGGPTSGGVMVRAAERQAAGLGQGMQAKASALYPNASAERAGRAVERGVSIFVDDIKTTREALYSKADQLIPETVTLPMARTRQALAELTTPNPNAPATTAAMVNPKIATLAKTVEADLAAFPKGLPYATVKDIRSRIGAELSDFSLTTDKPTAQYKRLYAALSQDMEEAARRQGPAAEQAAKRASNYFKVSAERISQLERVIDKAGGPEKVYSAVMSGTKDGGTTLRAVMQSLPPEGQKALTGAVLKRMGLATKGQQGAEGDAFSSRTFLTNWNGVSNEAKRALFDRHGPKFVSDMGRIARVAERIDKGSRVFANPSGTANKGVAYTYAGSLGASLLSGQLPIFAGLVASGAGANITARMMTNPKFVSWLARSTTLPTAAIPSQAAILARIAESENDPEMKALAEQLKKQGKNGKQP